MMIFPKLEHKTEIVELNASHMRIIKQALSLDFQATGYKREVAEVMLLLESLDVDYLIPEIFELKQQKGPTS